MQDIENDIDIGFLYIYKIVLLKELMEMEKPRPHYEVGMRRKHNEAPVTHNVQKARSWLRSSAKNVETSIAMGTTMMDNKVPISYHTCTCLRPFAF